MSLGINSRGIGGAVYQPSSVLVKQSQEQPVKSQLDIIRTLWDESKTVRHTFIQSNVARLYEIDSSLIKGSQWGDGCIPNIFKYIGSVFSRLWNCEEIKTLQMANAILKGQPFTKKNQTPKQCYMLYRIRMSPTMIGKKRLTSWIRLSEPIN